MRFVLLIAIFVTLISCRDGHFSNKEPSSKWTKLKDSFYAKNLTSFKLTDNAFPNLERLHKIKNLELDSTISEQLGSIYLYSWQERDTSFIDFTTIIREEDRGLRIVYYIFNRKDSLLSSKTIALESGDAEFKATSWSDLKTKDLLQLTSNYETFNSDSTHSKKKVKTDRILFYLNSEGKFVDVKENR